MCMQTGGGLHVNIDLHLRVVLALDIFWRVAETN